MELTIRCAKHRNVYKFLIIAAMFPIMTVVEAIMAQLSVLGSLLFTFFVASAAFIYDEIFEADHVMMINASDETIEICYNKTHIKLQYNDIKSVVLVNYCGRSYNDAYHRVKIVTKGKRYTFYNTTQEEHEERPYEQTDLAKLYNLLKSKGVNCC